MTSGDQVTARVRIVRCPRCHQLLPELPDLTVYRCGGCNAILKAKSQKTGNSVSGVQSNGSAQTTEFDRVSDDKDLGFSSNDAIILSSNKSHQNLNNITEQMKSDDNGQAKPVNWNSDCDLKNGTEFDHVSDDKDLGFSNTDDTILSSKKSHQNLNDVTEQMKSDNNGQGKPVNCNSDCDLKNGTEFDHVSDDKDLGFSSTDDTILSSKKSHQNLNDVTEQMKSDNNGHGKPVNCNSDCDLKNGTEFDHVSDDKDLGFSSNDAIILSSDKSDQNLNDITEQMKSDDNGQGKSVNCNSDCDVKNGTDSMHSENEPTVLAGGVAEEGIYVESLPVGDANDEGISSEIHYSSSPVQLEQPRDDDIVSLGSARGTSCADNFEASELEPNPSEINDVLLHSTKYLAENCLPVDGSIISDDEKFDQLPEQRLNFSHNIHKASSDFISEEEKARDDFFVRNMISKLKESETELRQRSSQSNLSDNNDQYIMKGTKRDPIGNWTKFGRERNSSRGHLYVRGSQNGNGNDNFLYPEWNDCCSDQYLDPEEEKMNLLRLVHELQDQLNKSCNFNRNANGFVSGPFRWKTRPEEILHGPYHSENLGRHTPAGYETRQHRLSRVPLSGEEILHGPYHSENLGRHTPAGYEARQRRFSRVPLSGGASSSGSQIDQAAYLHPHWQDIHRSMPLHPGLYRFSHDLNFQSSSPSSPQHYLSSQYPVRQWHKSQELHKQSRERRPLAKRHFRPMAGGAPFITCYNCFKPLQIPADLFLFKGRRHRLRCGACSEVLEFFLRGRNHIVPCMNSPPKENEEYSDDVYESIRASASYAVDPMSRTDNYGLPPSPISNVSSLQDNVNRSRNSYSNPLYYGEQRKEFGSKHYQKTSTNPVESYQFRGPPQNNSKAKKLSMEMNRLPPRGSGSPLHRLMGYSSISQIMNESGPSETRVQKRG